MKKILTLMLSITMTMAVTASDYFVDTTKGASGAGDSWENAYKTLLEAENAANGNAGVDNIYIKGGVTITTGGSWTLKAENYYFSCDPANTGTLTVRTPNDNDANGITESWEFKYPTVFSSTYATLNVSAVTLVASTTLDGLTITHTSSRTNGTGGACVNPIGGTIQNCVFTGSNLTYPGTATAQIGGCIIKNVGTLKNSLFDKNTVSITMTNSGSTDLKIYPILDVNLPSTSTTVSISGCVFRNNKVTIDYTGATSSACSYLRGMVLNISNAGASNTAGTKSTVTISDCVVHNNEITFNGNATFKTTPNACIAANLIFSGSNTTNNWINNTFANNKSTNLKNGCLALYVGGNSPDFAIHNVYNNVFWNNQNTISATSVTSNVSVASGSNQNVGTVYSNNVMDVGPGGNFGTALTNTGNLTDLSKTNTTATTGPQFKTANNTIGASASFSSGSDLTAISQSDWRLNLGSYLAGKGTVPASPLDALTTDKAGNTFATPRASGAYDFVKLTPVITWSQTLTGLNSNATLTATSNSDATYGAPLVYTPADPNIVTVTGSNMTLVATGNTTITASQAANAFYNAATPVTLNVSVTNVPTVLNEAATTQHILTPTANGIISEITTAIQVFSVSGKLIQSIQAVAGQKIHLQSGIYIIKANTEKGAFVQKVAL
jgi:hypothetical protein